eukprot:199634-Amphidinium_carterae.1
MERKSSMATIGMLATGAAWSEPPPTGKARARDLSKVRRDRAQKARDTMLAEGYSKEEATSSVLKPLDEAQKK